MADLYSVIAGIQPDQQSIIEAELLAKQILEAQFPDLDLREGTGVRDLVLRPAAFLLSLCKTGFDYYFSQNTLANIDDTSPAEIVDGILGNLFLNRNLGTQAVINVRLYFARQTAVTINTSTSFSTDGSLLFFPLISSTYPAGAMQYDSYQNEYYFDIDLLASEKGSSYNISSGSLLYFTNFNPYFLHGEINFLSQSSIAPESNTQFISRASTAISTRNLINKPSIDALLRQEFNYLNRVVVNGAGDTEMFRDQAEVSGATGVSRTGAAMTLSDSNTKMLVTLAGHGLLVGQLINLDESLGGALTLKRQVVSDIISSSQFKILLSVSVSPGSFAAPIVSVIEEDIFIHQGGDVDIHCGEMVNSKLSQYTLGANGKCVIEGANYSITRSLVAGTSTADTVPTGASFTVSFAGHASRADIMLTQSSGVVTLHAPSHCFVVGRMVKVTGWPTSISTLYLIITQVVDQDNVILGEDLPTYSIGSGLTPQVQYVYPTKDTGFSPRQELVVDFGVGYAAGVATMVLGYFENVDSIQSYLELSDNHVVCADLLARGYDVYVLDIGVTVYDVVAPTTGEISAIATTFLASLAPGAELILGDLVSNISANGISKLQTPVAVTYKYYAKDLFPVQTGTITDVLKPLNSTSIFLVGNVITAFTAP